MARKLRIQYEGAIYHITVRRVERRTLFIDDADRGRFLDRLAEGTQTYGVRLYLFCLMANHVHLLLETPHANLSAFMHQLQTAYTVYFNLRHSRAGHLLQGRFGAKPVQGDDYLLRLSRYIHLNPVFVGRIERDSATARREHLRRYPWSSYQGYAGLAKPYPFVDEAPVLAMTEAPESKQRAAYRRFVESGIGRTDAEFRGLMKHATWGIGDDAFQEQIRDLHLDQADRTRRREDVSLRRLSQHVDTTTVLDVVAAEFGKEPDALRQRQYGCAARAVAAFFLGRCAGMNQRDAATLLGMGTGAAVSDQLQRLRERQADDPVLTQQITRIAHRLESALHTRRAT